MISIFGRLKRWRSNASPASLVAQCASSTSSRSSTSVGSCPILYRPYFSILTSLRWSTPVCIHGSSSWICSEPHALASHTRVWRLCDMPFQLSINRHSSCLRWITGPGPNRQFHLDPPMNEPCSQHNQHRVMNGILSITRKEGWVLTNSILWKLKSWVGAKHAISECTQ